MCIRDSRITACIKVNSVVKCFRSRIANAFSSHSIYAVSYTHLIGRAKEYNIKWGISQGELVLNWAPYPDIPPAYVIPVSYTHLKYQEFASKMKPSFSRRMTKFV